ncbi:carbamoyltransferase C-terminal domain-containing protein [Pseudomonas caricapapayae]|nr:carbamoyltransferase C-terminal domain-containing protein [Pseudomonas caricapapayae]
MKILALHYGHDSAVSLISNGEVVACQLSERVKKKKLFIGVNSELIELFLKENKVDPSEIDCIAVTSTQREDLYIEVGGVLDISYHRHPDDKIPSLVEEHLQKHHLDPVDFFLGDTPKEKELRLRRMMIPHALSPLFREKAVAFTYLPWMDFAKVNHSTPYASLKGIVQELSDPAITFDNAEFGFHFPATAKFFGREMPCYLINHHAAHAASSYYLSGHSKAGVITADGGAGGMRGGWFFHGHDERLTPMAPHYLEIGGLYSETSKSIIKLGGSPDGKMMGLAPYGKPTLYSESYVGNAWDFDQLENNGRFPKAAEKRYAWHEHITQKAREFGYDLKVLGDPDKVLESANTDMAATLQKMFERTMLVTSEALRELIANRGLQADALCLAGGCMLNCPSNSNIYDNQIFPDVFVPPFTDDSGCAIGAGLWVYHNFFKGALVDRSGALPVSPYLGNPVSDDECLAALEAAKGINFSRPADPGAAAADDLINDKIIAFFDGNSEVGPRALGHRTLIADPRKAENWPKVNNIKTRALWRPFAPAVLKEELRTYFEGGPDNSPYMLFNATTKGLGLPAITHVDGTARVQTVTEENGAFHEVIKAFHRKTGCAVVMNTSFNGPNEPVIERPFEAIEFIRNSPGDVVLYLNGWRVTKS